MKKAIVSFVVGATLASGVAYAAGPVLQLRQGQVIRHGAIECSAEKRFLACTPGRTGWAVGISGKAIVVIDNNDRTRYSKQIAR